jgi:serine protease Do
MDDILLLGALERYLGNEMSLQEKAVFEELRKSNPEIDQLVVENTYFLQELDHYRAGKQYRHSLHEVEAKLSEEGLITRSQLNGKTKIAYLWNRYKRTVAVAASIAGIISLVSASFIILVTKNQVENTKTDLISYVNNVNNKTRIKINSGNNNSQRAAVTPQVDFRATSFLIDNKGYLLTNEHVVDQMKNIYVENSNGIYFNAKTIYTDKNTDLAILKISDSSFKVSNTPIPYSIKNTDYDLGVHVFTLGFPKSEIVYGEGYLSAKTGNDGDSTAYQLSVSANPGNSGGPVVNKNGEIVGVITAKDSKADGVVYAAKSKDVLKVINDLKASDSTLSNIKIPSGSALAGMDRAQQVKKMEYFVYMVVGN